MLIDEICDGTDPRQGAALAQSVLETLVKYGAKVAVTTHFAAIRALAMQMDSGFVSVALSSGRRDVDVKNDVYSAREEASLHYKDTHSSLYSGTEKDADRLGYSAHEKASLHYKDTQRSSDTQKDVYTSMSALSDTKKDVDRLGYSARNANVLRYRAVRGISGESEPLTAAERSGMCVDVLMRARELTGDQLKVT